MLGTYSSHLRETQDKHWKTWLNLLMREGLRHLYHTKQLDAYLTKTISMLEFKHLRKNYQRRMFQKGIYLLKSIEVEELMSGKESSSLMNQ
jgi:hypothetical protein